LSGVPGVRRTPSTTLRMVPLPRSAGEEFAPPYPPLRLQSVGEQL